MASLALRLLRPYGLWSNCSASAAALMYVNTCLATKCMRNILAYSFNCHAKRGTTGVDR